MTGAQPGRRGRDLVGRLGGVAGALVLGQVLVGLTYVVAARGMGPAGLGVIATCFAIGAIGSTVFDLGLNGYLVREVAAGRVRVERARSWVAAKRRVVPLLLVPDVAACLLITRDPTLGLLLGAVGWVVWEAQAASTLLRAQERFGRATTAQLTGRTTGLGLTVALSLTGRPELGLSAGLVVSFLVEAAVGRLHLGHRTGPVARRDELVAAHRRTLSFGLVSLAAIGQQLDTPLVTAGGGALAGGIYAGAGRLLGPLLFLSSSLNLVGSPWLARAQREPAVLRREERRVARMAAVLALVPLGAAAVGPQVIPWLLGSEFTSSGPTFAVLAVGAALSTVNQGMATTLQNRGAERRVGTGIGIGLCLGLATTFVLASVGGPVWAAVGFPVAQCYMAGHLWTAMRRTAAG